MNETGGDDQRAVVRVRVAHGEPTLLPGAGPDGPAAYVVRVEAGSSEPDRAQVAALAAALADAHLVSVAHASGHVSAVTAALVLACDFVVASADSLWDEAKGEVESAARRRLPAGKIAALHAHDGPLTGADLHRIGLVTDVAGDPERAADALAVELNAVPAGSLAGSKEMIDAAAASDLDAALKLESRLQVTALLSEDHQRIIREMAARSEEGPQPPRQT